MGVEVEAKVWAVERIRGEVILSVEEGAMEWLGGKVEGEKEENGEEGEELGEPRRGRRELAGEVPEEGGEVDSELEGCDRCHHCHHGYRYSG